MQTATYINQVAPSIRSEERKAVVDYPDADGGMGSQPGERPRRVRTPGRVVYVVPHGGGLKQALPHS
jgi:hypothetical protein